MIKWQGAKKKLLVEIIKRLKFRLWLRGFNKATQKIRRLLEHRRLKQVIGVNLLSVMVLLSQVSLPAAAQFNLSEGDLGIIVPLESLENIPEAEIATKTGFQAPFHQFTITQSFHLSHLGVDLATSLGTNIRPVAAGVVERVESGRYGFGNSVLIDHGANLKSFYAHLGSIKVRENQSVTIEDQLGTVGLSGRTTGAHLHLEIWQNDRPLNPKAIISLRSY